MNISAPFIKRPIATSLAMMAIMLFGIAAYRLLPVSDLPTVDFPTILVTASLPGATPETMASAVATPLEKQFSTIAGLDSMTSTSGQGNTQITLQFTLDRDIDAAAQDVQAAIAKTASQLPPELPSPPSYQKVNPADQPVIYMSLSSPTLPLSDVDEYAETLVAERISMISGVAQVQVFGSQKFAVRAQMDPAKLQTRGIGIDEVTAGLASANVNLPTGTLYGKYKAYTIQATGQLLDARQYRPIIVTYRNGAPIRLGELGRVINSVENDKVASWFNDTRAIVLAVQRQPGTNTIEVVDGIKQVLPVLRTQIPPTVSVDVLYDRSVGIRESVSDVKFTLLLALVLVVIVIFLFLRNVSATLIPSLALPLSIVGTFAAMYLLGYSLDNLSLMALTLSIGFVVDDAIVMLENIVRHMEKGEPPMQAAYSGSSEIGFTILSMTLSLVAVFIPVLFMGGILGRLLHEFSIVITVAILISGFVSLTLTPMLCSRFLKPPKSTHGRFYNVLESFFNRMLSWYEKTLRVAMRHRLATMVIYMFFFIGSLYLFGLIPKGFLPSEDTGAIFSFTEAAQGISYDSMVAHQKEVMDVVRDDPAVKQVISSVGAGGPNVAGNSGRIFMMLKPLSERDGVDDVIQRLRPKLAKVPGISVFMQNLPPIRIGGQLTKGLYQFTLQSPNTGELFKYAPMLEEKLKTVSGLQDVTSDLLISSPQVNVVIDRDKASALGVTAQQVEDGLFSAYGTRQVSTIFAPTNQYKVILELLPQYQAEPFQLDMLYIRSDAGKLVPLSATAQLTQGVGPLSITHTGQLPSVTISFNLKPGFALGDAIKAVDAVAKTILPPTITATFQGAAQAFQRSLTGVTILLIMAVLIIYIILGMLYESYVHPVTILTGLPAAAFGALITLMVFGKDLNIYAVVGVIMLMGIVKKNAIMMIDFALERQRVEGHTPEDAIVQGALIRFRPIMMTTMSAFMATLPIALGTGAGAVSRRPLGLAVIGGLVVSQSLTLYITPVFYVYMERFKDWVGRRKKVR